MYSAQSQWQIDIINEKSSEKIYNNANDLYEKFLETRNFTQSLGRIKVEVKEFKELGINTLNKIEELKSLGLDENKLSTLIFNLKYNDISEVIEDKDNNLHYVYLDKINQSRQQNLKQVKNDIVNLMYDEARDSKSKKIAEEFKKTYLNKEYDGNQLLLGKLQFKKGDFYSAISNLFEVYETSDGAVVLIIIAVDDVFSKFCSTFNLTLQQDEKYNNLVSRIINKEELTEEINKVTRGISTAELVELMDKEEISASVCNQLDEVHTDPQVVDQGSIALIEHPELGTMRMPKPPANFKGQDAFPRSLAPVLGHDNREVLSSIGVEGDTIDRMEERERQNRELLASLMPTN